jgi:hypothetical protein
MAERAAHLLDHVFPDVPVRQWVLSLPYRLRYQLAWDHDVCRAVVGVLLRAVFRVLGDRARDDASRCSCRDRASIWCCTTACWALAPRGGVR